jgi:hypothetical protein
MALSTYTELKAAIADTAHRSDLTTPIIDFITQTEARLYDMLLLKDMESDESLTLTINVNYVALPTGYISPIAFWLVVDSERVPLKSALPQELPYDTDSQQPQYWAIDGANIRFDCPAASGYSAYLRCFKKSNLSGSTASNYILTRRPDIYLAGALVELYRYTGDFAKMQVWEQKFQQACEEFKKAENRNRSIVPLRSDLPGFSPRVGNIFRGE